MTRDVAVGQTYRFPNSFIWDEPDSVSLFILDPPNELYSTTSGSDGSIVFQSLDLQIGGTVEFRIDAVVGSEYHSSPSVRARGSFVTSIQASPLD